MPREGRSYRKRSRSRSTSRSPDRSKKRKSRSRSPKSRTRRSRSRERVRRSRSRDRDRSRRSRSRERTQRSRRSRSRDRERDRDRDRDRDKNRDREKDKDRDRKRSTSRERNKKSRSKTPEKVIEGAIKVKDEPMDKEAEQKRLEDEMQKRRERIEKWREDRKKTIVLPQINIAPPSKTWSLEDDADDEEEEVKQENGADDEDEIDPLDAYMQQVNDEVKHVKSNLTGAGNQAGTKGASVSEPVSKVTFVTAVAKSKDDPAKKKGELMESNIDAMEYSSEEEEEGVEEMFAGMQKKKKEFLAIDHSKIYYGPFKKDFYVEVPELTKMSQEEVDQLRDELEGIKVRGKGCPKPIRNWAQCGVSKKIMECLKRYDYEKPTPIQAQAIPAIMSGRDVIGIAKTGSGKTLAFLLPMLRHVLDQPPLEEGDGSIAIILTPTRELAMQITKECKKFTKNLGLQAVCVYGGTGISEQIAELKRGAEIIVCTPGRMIDMLAANNGRVTNCRRCTFVVLDEADRMFDMGFEPQVMRIVDNIRPDRQTVMFSATFPRQMEALARKILTKPIEVQVGGRSVVCKDVEQHVVVIDDDSKFFKLLELLGVYQEQGSVLVFVDKQEHADELMKNLMKHSYPCMSLHGGIDQYDRDSTITDFKQGNVKLLVATSVAARGLDVKHLILVVNYDCPNHYEDYVHRCGRTGRAGNKGFAYTFITPEQERYANDIIKALEQSGAVVPADLQKLWDDYKARAEAEGKKIKSSSGFRGKGFKFDETEAHLADERKKLQKAALGLQDSDEEDAGIDIDQQIEDMFASKTRVTDVHQPMINQQAQPTASNQQKLELAKRLASMINRQKNLGAEAQDITQQAAASILQGLPSQAPQVSAKTIAEQMAEKINAKIGYRPPAEEEKEGQEQQGETFKRYELELEINDFPQTARWKVTSKEALAQICEYSEAGITVRGTYFPPGKLPKEEERKLYLAIEATSELSIQKAKTEITRLIKEELVRLQNSYQPINRGRYKVL
ncbi:probable ATP-dependent RNA helicase DDX46 isoform X4 [Lingula anatina]|uniref:Probable ATP-dependent RNA helicase DDX46 n=1 Tax=Lingula anatina TaxID=7574 RepID=A0A1S3JX53_LINAN|nr:probable ATP-dependent RNA helicase DDX46 isoform X4 [Lingula anatina]|eukprot:XP_013414892.1 probable ATP-dependent RNA helicase DDX46 isoform X4 [Lingula anatina]